MSLDGDGNARQYSTAAAVGPPIDWPVHAPVPEERREQGKSHLPLIRYLIWVVHSVAIIGDSNEVSWLDFLANNPPSSTSMQMPAFLPSSNVGEGASSCERDRPFLGSDVSMIWPSSSYPDGGGSSGVGSPKRKSSKRPRVDSGTDDGQEEGLREMKTRCLEQNLTRADDVDVGED